MKKWHVYTFFGMWGAWGTDVYMQIFTRQIKDLGVDVHESPYNDMDATSMIHVIHAIPEDEGVFLAGTSLGANNIAIIAYSCGRRIDGMFGFQASLYGVRGYPIQNNVRWAHLTYSYNPWPFPGLGAYRWPQGSIPAARYIRTGHHIPHPGDYDDGDRAKYIAEIKRITAGAP